MQFANQGNKGMGGISLHFLLWDWPGAVNHPRSFELEHPASDLEGIQSGLQNWLFISI